MRQLVIHALHAIANTADNLASKLATNMPEPLLDYKNASVIHYGEFRFGDYYAKATPHRSYHVWDGDDYIGEYFGERIEIVEQLHAKDQKRP